MAGPSGAGKSTLANYLMEKRDDLAFSISATTRKPRKDEVDGKHYHFLSPEEFGKKIDEEGFVEHEEVYKGIHYGTLKSELERIWTSGKTPLLDVDVDGALSIRQNFKEQGLFIFVHPVNEEKLRQRLIKRGTESGDSLEERIARSKRELKQASRFDTVIYNDNLQKARSRLLEVAENYLRNNSKPNN